jgi:hypothetical protein
MLHLNRFCIGLVLVLLSGHYAQSQVLPEPGAKLNYTQVMLEHPKIPGSEQYVIEVYENYGTVDFKHPPVIVQKDSSTASLICGLKFGTKYMWRYAGLKNGQQSSWSGPYAFEILKNPFANRYRVRVLKNDSSNNMKGLICSGGIRSIIDRQGNTVLFVPEMTKGSRRGAAVENLELTKYGTLCSYGNQNAYETDLRYNILWQTPHKVKNRMYADFSDFYNHDFQRLDDGNYMVIGSDYYWKTLPDEYSIYDMLYDKRGRKMPDSLACKNGTIHLKSGYTIQIKDDVRKMLMNMASLCEYDKQDSLLWSWYPESYVKYADIFPPGKQLKPQPIFQEPHLNGFCVDAKGKYIYVSFRNLSRVIKLDKRTGKVVQSWGDRLPSGEAKLGNGFFQFQHNPEIPQKGEISVYDDEDASKSGYSNAVIFSEPTWLHPKGKIVWKYECRFDSLEHNRSERGGSVIQLPDKNLLVCQGSINQVFEINRKKYISWRAVFEKKGKNSIWVPAGLYRAYYTSSLYPCYFTAQTDKDTLSAGNATFRLRVFNKGTENDSYSIKISIPSSNNPPIALSSAIVPPDRSQVIKIPLVNHPAENSNIEVEITSNTNKNLQKKLVLQWSNDLSGSTENQ